MWLTILLWAIGMLIQWLIANKGKPLTDRQRRKISAAFFGMREADRLAVGLGIRPGGRKEDWIVETANHHAVEDLGWLKQKLVEMENHAVDEQ